MDQERLSYSLDQWSINAPDYLIIFINDMLHINDVILKNTKLMKLIGPKIDVKLTFHQHTSDLCRRVRYHQCILSRFSGVLDIESKAKLVNAFIVWNIMSCPLVWHLCSLSDTMKIVTFYL